MSVEVIRKGPEYFESDCGTCGSRLRYEYSDVVGGYVECPVCGSKICHYVNYLNSLNNNGNTSPFGTTTLCNTRTASTAQSIIDEIKCGKLPELKPDKDGHILGLND